MISIIVPVYNVEPYLEQCLDSIIHQTYRDIEIIVVNDGSTDRSGEICRAYAGRDPRIVLFETENRGLSAARNLGIDNAHGEWIMFVDSDDWVEPEFCEAPLRAAMENDADLVVFCFTKVCQSGQTIPVKLSGVGNITREMAVECGRPAVWNKLYRRRLFDTIHFPEGRRYEDVAVTHRLVYRSKQIMMMETPLYYYRIRDGSILRSGDRQIEKELYLSCLQRYADLLSYGFPKKKIDTALVASSLRYLEEFGLSDDPLIEYATEVVSTFEVDSEMLDSHQRNCLRVWKLNKGLFYNMYGKRKALLSF